MKPHKTFTHILDTRGLQNANDDERWTGRTMCGMTCGAQHTVKLGTCDKSTCSECRRARRERDKTNVIGRPEVP